MADSIEDTGNLETLEQNENAIFDNDDLELEEQLFQKFTQKEEEPEAEPEAEEEETEEQEEEGEEIVAEEEEPEEEEAEEVEPEAELSDKQQAAFDKRIQRELKKLRKEHEDAMAELTKAKEEAETPTDALSQVKATMDLKSLSKIEEDAEKTIDFVEDNPDGFTINSGKENERFMDREELLGMKRNARAAIKAAKQRRVLIEERNAFDAEVHKAYPSLKDKGSQEYVAVEAVFNEIPALREHPKGTAFAIYMLLGEEAASKPQKKVAKKKKKEPEAPKLPDSKPPAPKPAAKAGKKSINVDDIMAAGGDGESIENALLAQFSN